MTAPSQPQQPPRAQQPSRRPPPRTLWSDLRGIDRIVVPRIARSVGDVRAAVRDFGPTVDRGRGGAGAVLDRLDERYARRGLLGLVRDVPQLGAMVLATLLVVAAITVLVRDRSNGSDQVVGTPDLPAVSGPRAVTVGPIAGELVSEYLARARSRLAERARTAPTSRTFAIADFEHPLSPADAAAALPGVTASQVFLNVHAPDGACGVDAAYPVTGLADGAITAFGRVADCLEQQAVGERRFAESITVTNDEQARQRRSQLADAGHEESVAARLRDNCPCLIAVVVTAPAQLLANIANSGTVRVIDPAQPGLRPGDIAWVPLRPGDHHTVPIPSAPPTLPTGGDG